MQLIGIETNDKGFYVPEETKCYLQGLKTTINPICAIGPYRSGKSDLLNRLCEKHDAFPTSSGSQACTRGIHMATSTITSNHLMFMDTEGLGAPQSTVEIDSRILACAILFSAKVYFFGVGKIDTKLLESMQCAIGTAQWLKDTVDVVNHKPQFVLLLKDVSLELRDENGNQLTPDQYFQKTLEQYCKSIGNSNLIDALDALFAERHCLTMCIPCKDTDMKEMKQLYPEYLRDLKLVKQNAYHNTKPKLLDGQTPMNGPILLQLAQSLCVALNSPGAPKLTNVWDAAMNQIAIEKRNQLINAFERKLLILKVPKLTFLENKWPKDLFDMYCAQQRHKPTNQEFTLVLERALEIVQETETKQNLLYVQHIADTNIQELSQSVPPQFNRIFDEWSLAQRGLQTSMEELKSKKDELETLEVENAALKTIQTFGSGDPTIDVSNTAETIANLENELHEQKMYNEQLLSMFESYKTNIRSKLDTQQCDYQRCQSDLNTCQQSLQELTQENDKLKKEVRETQQLVEERSKELTQVNRKRKSDESILSVLTNQISSAKQQAVMYNAEISKVRSESNNYKNKCNDLTRQLFQIEFQRSLQQ